MFDKSIFLCDMTSKEDKPESLLQNEQWSELLELFVGIFDSEEFDQPYQRTHLDVDVDGSSLDSDDAVLVLVPVIGFVCAKSCDIAL